MSKSTRPTLADIRKWPAAIPVTQAAEAMYCSRAWLYAAIKREESPVKTIKIGSRYVVVTADLVRLLSGEDQAA